MIRPDRAPGEMRPCSIEIDGPGTNERSVIIRVGKTEVLCSASVERGVPRFLRDGLGGWLTAEYSMLPSSTPRRKRRDRGSRVDGRDLEIQRLIGRSIRAALGAIHDFGRPQVVRLGVLIDRGGRRNHGSDTPRVRWRSRGGLGEQHDGR